MRQREAVDVKVISIRTTWEVTQDVDVPDDYEVGSGLDDEWISQVDCSGASLIDWEQVGRLG